MSTSLLIVFLGAGRIFAQNSVSIGTNNINNNAVLWLNSPNKNQGLIIPVVSGKSAVTPVAGMIVFDEGDKKIYCYDGIKWISLSGSSTNGGGDLLSINNLSDLSNVATSRLNLGLGSIATLSSITSTEISNSTITDADISPTAAIAGTKVNPAFGTQNISTTGTLSAGASTTLNTVNYTWPNAQAIGTRVLQNDGTGNLTWATPSAGLSSTLNSSNIFVGNASNVASGVAMSGDATIANTGALTIANNAITSAKINDGTISDADISATAAIAGTKVNPAFGTQNISTTGTLSAGASTTLNTVNYTWPNAQAIGTRVLQNDGTGNLTWATPSAGLSSTLNSANIFVGNASNVASGVAMSGDATISNTGATMVRFPMRSCQQCDYICQD